MEKVCAIFSVDNLQVVLKFGRPDVPGFGLGEIPASHTTSSIQYGSRKASPVSALRGAMDQKP